MAKATAKGRGLGRGLSALMSDVGEPSPASTPPSPDRAVPIDRIVPNPDQPRRSFDDDAMSELASSIAEKGVIQPLIVRPAPGRAGHFEIVAGERRWRASQIAKLHELPVIVRDFDDTEMLEIAIIENIQRADLNPVDEAAGYRQLMDRFGHTQDQLAQGLGKSRSHIANTLRLLALPAEIQTWLAEGRLTPGHARALIGQDDAIAVAKTVIAKQLSVRETEKLIRDRRRPGGKPRDSSRSVEKDADTRQIEAELSATLKMHVSLDHAPNGEGGKLTLGYRSLDQLDDLLRLLSGN